MRIFLEVLKVFWSIWKKEDFKSKFIGYQSIETIDLKTFTTSITLLYKMDQNYRIKKYIDLKWRHSKTINKNQNLYSSIQTQLTFP